MSKSATTAAKRLADLLGRENDALERLDLPAVAALVIEKEAAVRDLAAAPSGSVTEVPAALGQRLRDLAAANHRLLERAIKVQARVIEIVAGAYKPAPATLCYGPSGEQPVPSLSGVAFSTRV